MIVSRKMFLAAVGLMLVIAALVLALHPAKAADGPRWTGVYAGASVGYASTTTEASVNATGMPGALVIDGLGTSGVSAGLVVGADIRIQNFLLGAFADWMHHDQSWSVSSSMIPGGTLASLDIDSQWTVGGRAGVIVNESTLIYGLVGYTSMQTSDIESPFLPVGLSVSDFKGWTVGGGLETHLGNNIYLGAEYRFTKFDSQNVVLVSGLADLDLEPVAHEARARLTYKFALDLK